MLQGFGKSDKWLVLIGVLKLFKGAMLLLVAIGVLRLIGGDVAMHLEQWCRRLNVDAENRWLHEIIEKVSGLTPRKMSFLSAGTFFYSALFLTEGVGLSLKKRWAEFFTVIVTASFLPLEIYEIVKEFKPIRLALVIVNAAIVVYLIWRLARERNAGQKRRG